LQRRYPPTGHRWVEDRAGRWAATGHPHGVDRRLATHPTRRRDVCRPAELLGVDVDTGGQAQLDPVAVTHRIDALDLVWREDDPLGQGEAEGEGGIGAGCAHED